MIEFAAMLTKFLLYLLWMPLGIQSPNTAASDSLAATLRTNVQQATKLPLERTDLKAVPPQPGWEMGMVSWVTSGSQRLDLPDPARRQSRSGSRS